MNLRIVETIGNSSSIVNPNKPPKVYQWIKKIQSCLFPPTCLLCGAPGTQDRDLCLDCLKELPYNRHPCYLCATPLAAGTDLICGQCQQQRPVFDRVLAPLLYQRPLDGLVKALKFNGELTVARLLGEWLGDFFQERDARLPECIIPIPLHSARLRERGFNQALELARPIARRLHKPLLTNAIRRIRNTAPQSLIDIQARQHNLRGAFILHRPVTARHVAIFDDVITTGSTVAEISRVLRNAGVEEIEVWACARTPHRHG